MLEGDAEGSKEDEEGNGRRHGEDNRGSQVPAWLEAEERVRKRGQERVHRPPRNDVAPNVGGLRDVPPEPKRRRA